MAFQSLRLLNEAIHKEMEALRKLLMSAPPSDDVTDDGQNAIETLNIIRNLFNELAAKADRPTIEDVTKLSPGDYVATMKPLVRMFHQQLMSAGDLLASCLCEDLQASGVVLMLIGDGKTVVKTAVDPRREEVQLAIEIILQSLDMGMKKVAEDGVAAAEEQLGISAPENGECKVALGLMEPDPCSGGCDQPTCMRCYPEAGDPPLGNLTPGYTESADDERTRLLKKAEAVGWDTDEGMALRERAKNYAEGEKLT